MSDSPAPPDDSYTVTDEGGWRARHLSGWRPTPVSGWGSTPVPPVRPIPSAPPPQAPARGNRRVIVAAAGAGAVLVFGSVGIGVHAIESSAGHDQGGGSTYQVPAGPTGRIDVTLSGGINDHFVGAPGSACGTVGIGMTSTQLLQVDTANATDSIQFVVQVVPNAASGTFTAPARVRSVVNYRQAGGGIQVLNARSGQVQVSGSSSKLSGRFDLQVSGRAGSRTRVTGTFTCG